MKNEILTNKDCEFRKYRWWSDWIDICVFNYAGCGYLLQMKISRYNAKKFNCTAMKNLIAAAHPTIGEVGELTDKEARAVLDKRG